MGLGLQPLYGPGDAPHRAAPLRTRAGWDIRAEAHAPAEALEALEGGATSLLLLTPDIEAALDGVVLEAAGAALDAGFSGPDAARRLAAVAKGSPAARLELHLDPLGAFAASGMSPGPVEAHLEAAAQTAAGLAPAYPEAGLCLASGRVVHEAGGSPAQELGFMAASAVAYARALVDAGLAIDRAFGAVVLGLSVDADHLAGIAKLRAAREIWARLAGACGAQVPARIEARGSRRMLAAPDPWTNLIRLTAAGFAGAAGGADALVLPAFTDPLGAPAAPALRQSRNIQLILAEEAGVGDQPDPAAGAWAIEAMTDQLARAGWAAFQAIEAEGGALAALRAGRLAREVAAARDAEASAVADGSRPVLGVTQYPDPSPVPAGTGAAAASAAFADPRLPGPDSHCQPLAPVRLSQAAEEVVEDLVP